MKIKRNKYYYSILNIYHNYSANFFKNFFSFGSCLIKKIQSIFLPHGRVEKDFFEIIEVHLIREIFVLVEQ